VFVLKILVIGGGGQLGYKIIHRHKQAHDFFATYISRKPDLDPEKYYVLDKTKKTEVTRRLKKISPNAVVDTAAIHNVDYCERNPEEAHKVNVEGSLNVAEACHNIDCKYVFISTDYVFDGEKGLYSEIDMVNPINYYGKTKLEAEKKVVEAVSDHLILRPSVIYSWVPESQSVSSSGKPLNFAQWLALQLENEKKVNIVTDQYSSPTLADNFADCIIGLCEEDKVGLYHVSGRNRLNRYEFSVKLAETFGYDDDLINPIISSQLNQFASRPRDTSLDVSKVEKVHGVNILDINDALKVFYEQAMRG
jgi:dTDP-4-dehydrorhamnose reductase